MVECRSTVYPLFMPTMVQTLLSITQMLACQVDSLIQVGYMHIHIIISILFRAAFENVCARANPFQFSYLL